MQFLYWDLIKKVPKIRYYKQVSVGPKHLVKDICYWTGNVRLGLKQVLYVHLYFTFDW